MRTILPIALLVFACLPKSFAQTSCASYNLTNIETPWDPSGVQEHATGSHTFSTNTTESCSYSSIGQQFCASSCYAEGSAFGTDTGTIAAGLLPHSHTLGAVVNPGTSNANGAQIQCGATAAVTVTSCVIGTSCGATIGFSGGVNGIGVSVSFPPSSIMGTSQPYQMTCALRSDPSYNSCTDGVTCHCCTCAGGTGCASPIIVDTVGEGFRLTSASDGVIFDIRGDGRPIQLAWTAWGSHNAFLALDRNHNGIIDSGKELFGNYTAQPKCANENGFLALEQFDKPENGGNGDGVIDKRDAIYSQLRLWIDVNHDGISEPGELHTLEEMGVYSLALNYTESKQTDRWGNAFRYKAKVNPEGEPYGDQVDRWTYDVWLVTETDMRHGHVTFGAEDVIFAGRPLPNLSLKEELK